MDKAIAAHGVPQKLLTDNGVSLNPSRRGALGQLVTHLARLGVKAITGKPYKPTTQGKNERFHQTLCRYLDKQPLAETLDELQTQVDTFDHLYNTERPHQGLPGRVTPQTAWEATPKAEPPRPITQTWLEHSLDPMAGARFQHPRIDPATIDLPANTRLRTIGSAATLVLNQVTYKLDTDHAFKQVLVVTDPDTSAMTITDLNGETLTELTPPAPGVTYVGNGRPRGPRPKTPRTSPKS